MGENSCILLKRNFFSTYTVDKNSPMTFTLWNFHGIHWGWVFTPDFNIVKLSQCSLCGHFARLWFHQHTWFLVNTWRIKIKAMKCYRCSSKIEGVMNFQMNTQVFFFYPWCTAKLKVSGLVFITYTNAHVHQLTRPVAILILKHQLVCLRNYIYIYSE